MPDASNPRDSAEFERDTPGLRPGFATIPEAT